MDSIRVTDIRAYGYTGYLPEERVLGQWFVANLTLELDLSAAGQSDDLGTTFDYRQAITTVQQLIKTQRFKLVETLAAAIADALLQFKTIRQVEVELSKPAPPIPDFGGAITICLRRQQPR